MARKIRIIRRKKPDVLRMSGTKLPKESYGSGVDNTPKAYWCCWCFFPKSSSTVKCADCGRFGATDRPQKAISQVYIEDNPVF